MSPRRWVLVLGALLLAPVCAEFSSGYLPSTGNPLALVGQLVVFSPLYGGALLLIRETVVRLGGGWPSRLLLAAAFGIAMPGLVDLSLFTTVRDDVAGWDQIFTPTYVDALGTSLGAATTWATGHVILSIGAPLAIVEGLSGRPDVARERWLRLPGLVLTAVAFVAAVVVVNVFQRHSYVIEVSRTQVAVVSLLVAALVAVGVAWAQRWPSRPGSAGSLRVLRAVRLVLGGVVVTFAGDAAATSWGFLVACWVVLLLAAPVLLRSGRRSGWSLRHAALFAVGALVSRAATSFANPPPDGVTESAKLAQNAVFAVVVLLLLVAVSRRRRSPGSPRAGHPSTAGAA